MVNQEYIQLKKQLNTSKLFYIYFSLAFLLADIVIKKKEKERFVVSFCIDLMFPEITEIYFFYDNI